MGQETTKHLEVEGYSGAANRNHDIALEETRWVLGLVKGSQGEMSLEDRQRISSQTVENFASHINAGFLEHRKSATMGGEFAPWEFFLHRPMLIH
jgi:hypothetical protein